MRILNHQNFEYIKKIQKKYQLDFNGVSILDVGVGGGYLAGEIIKENSVVKYIGVDIDNYLEKNVKNKVSFVKADLNHLPDVDALLKTKEKYDYIFIFDVLEHLIYFHHILQNIHTILSPKGKLLISVPIDINLSTKIKMVFQDSSFTTPFASVYGHINLFSFRQFEEGLRNIKTLEIIDINKCGLGYGLYDKTFHLDMWAKLCPMMCGRANLYLRKIGKH